MTAGLATLRSSLKSGWRDNRTAQRGYFRTLFKDQIQLNNPTPDERTGGPRWIYWPTAFAAMAIVVLDQLSKAFMVALLQDQADRAEWVIEPYLKMRLVHNDGIVFGIFSGAFSSWATIIFVSAALLVVVAIFVRYLREPTLAARIVLGSIIGAGAGNLIDRFRLGYVIDFVDVGWWPVFNVADAVINISMVALLLLALIGKLERPAIVPR